MEETGMKEVYYWEWCSTCKHYETKDYMEPCHDCLNEPVNQYSHKPVRYEGKN